MQTLYRRMQRARQETSTNCTSIDPAVAIKEMFGCPDATCLMMHSVLREMRTPLHLNVHKPDEALDRSERGPPHHVYTKFTKARHALALPPPTVAIDHISAIKHLATTNTSCPPSDDPKQRLQV